MSNIQRKNANRSGVSAHTAPERLQKADGMEETVGALTTREEVMRELRGDPENWSAFLRLPEPLQEELVEYCMGVRGLRVTYDAVFKDIFHPEVHPERLEELLSIWLGQEVRILRALPNDSLRMTEESSLLIMDLLVELEDGSLVNVEIQRVGYLFPGARCACYSSDLIMRQYSQIRAQKRKEEKPFSYRDIKKVYTIVLFQRSTQEFHDFPNEYMHYGKQTFNTGLGVDMLQEYLLIPLDIFQAIHHNKPIEEKSAAWLLFIASDQICDIRRIIEAYPEFKELYRQVFRFRYQKGELISMYSEILSEFDANTVQYMVEQQQMELERKDEIIERQKEELAEERAEVMRLRAELEALKRDRL